MNANEAGELKAVTESQDYRDREHAVRPCAQADPLGDPLTIQDVAELLGCSVWTVRKKCLPRGLPHFRIGTMGKLVFYRVQVTRWILDQQELHRRRR